MNLSTIALLLLGWQLLSGCKEESQQFSPLQMLSEDNRNLLEDITKLSDKNTTSEQKTSAILDLVGNPAVMSLATKLLGNATDKEDGTSLVNDEGYNFGKFDAACKDCFRPVDKIADAEVKSKLYNWYDWYVK